MERMPVSKVAEMFSDILPPGTSALWEDWYSVAQNTATMIDHAIDARDTASYSFYRGEFAYAFAQAKRLAASLHQQAADKERWSDPNYVEFPDGEFANQKEDQRR